MIKLYRLQSARYGLPKDFLSGKGAEITGGRWNPVGMPVVYTSHTVELASLEYLVHYFEGFPTSRLPKLLVATLEIADQDILTIDSDFLPKNWRDNPAPHALQLISNQWFKGKKHLGLQIPTAVHSMPTELSYNVLLNPVHESMKNELITKIEPFYFDSRYKKPQIQGNQMNDLIEDILEKM